MTSYLKAIVACLVAALTALYQAFDKGGVTDQEWVAVVLSGLLALGTVWGVPNLDPKGKRQRESVQPPDRGAVDWATALLIVFFVVVILLLVGAIR